MSIISSGIKAGMLAAALICVSSLAIAETPSPETVNLEGGRVLLQKDRKLVEVDAAHSKEFPLRFPATFKRAVTTASSVAFPADRSHVIDGKEYILVVVNQSSSNDPMGYCGAGEEGTLYVFQIEGNKAEPRFSLPVQSCLKSVALATETGTKSPYLAIAWNDAPIGIKIVWEHDADKGPAASFIASKAEPLLRHANNALFRDLDAGFAVGRLVKISVT